MQPTAQQLQRVSELITLTAETVLAFTEGKFCLEGQADRLVEISERLETYASEVAAIAEELDRKSV